jgi:hypothetical protein
MEKFIPVLKKEDKIVPNNYRGIHPLNTGEKYITNF